MTSQRQNKSANLYVQLQYTIREQGGVECEQLPFAFFPEDSVHPSERRLMVSTAKEVCNRCPVQNQCADYGLAANEDYGIWGGLTAEDRKTLRRK